MKTLIEGKNHFYEGDYASIDPNQVRAYNISRLLKGIQDEKGSFVRIENETYGRKCTEWLCYNPITGSLFVHTNVRVCYTDYSCDNKSYTVESDYDAIDSITLEEAQQLFEVTLSLV